MVCELDLDKSEVVGDVENLMEDTRHSKDIGFVVGGSIKEDKTYFNGYIHALEEFGHISEEEAGYLQCKRFEIFRSD